MGHTLREWIARADEHGRLQRITAEVDWYEEMSGIVYLGKRTGGTNAPAFLFENIKDYQDTIGGRMIWNARIPALDLGIDPDGSPLDIIRTARGKLGNKIQPTVVDPEDAPLYENSIYGDDIDLYEFPAPKCWPFDGPEHEGRYIGTANATVSRNPETGVVNVATYRHMLRGSDQTVINVAEGKDLRRHMEMQWETGEPLEIAVAFGVSPTVLKASGSKKNEGENEYEYVGGLRGEPIELVEGELTGIPVPAHAEIVAEGRLEPYNYGEEGPFGEFSGMYGHSMDETPIFDVEALHYRNDPILTGALMDDTPKEEVAIYHSARIWNALDDIGLPGVRGVYRSPHCFSMSIVSIEQMYPGHPEQAAVLATHVPDAIYNHTINIVVDADIDPTNLDEVMWALATRYAPEHDTQILRNVWGYHADPALPDDMSEWGSKILIDATTNYKHYEPEEVPERTTLERAIYEAIGERWEELGFEDQEFPDLRFLVEEGDEPTGGPVGDQML